MFLSNLTRLLKKKKMIIFITFFTAVILLLPEIVKYELIKTLNKKGAERVEVRDVDLNLFAGSIAVKDLRLGSPQKDHIFVKKLSANIGIFSLLRKHICLENLMGYGIDVSLIKDGDTLKAGMLLNPYENSAGEKESKDGKGSGSDFLFGLTKLVIENSSFKFTEKSKSNNFQVENLSVSEVFPWNENNKSSVILSSSLNNAPLNLISSLELFGSKKMISAEIKFKDFNLNSLESYTKTVIDNLKGSLSLKSHIEIFQGEKGAIKTDENVSLKINGVSGVINKNSQEKLVINGADFSWNGTLNSLLSKDFKLLSLNFDGKLANDKLNCFMGDHLIDLKHNGFSWEGNLGISSASSEKGQDFTKIIDSLSTTGNIKLSGLDLKSEPEKLSLVNFKEFKVNNLTTKGVDDIKAEKVSLSGCNMGETQENTLIKNDNFDISEISLSKRNTLIIGKIYSGLTGASIIIDKDKKISSVEKIVRIIDTFGKTTSASSAAEQRKINEQAEVNTPAKKNFNFSIGSFELAKGSKINFFDRSLNSSFKQVVEVVKASAKEISGDPDKYASVDIELMPQKHSRILLAGTFLPISFGNNTMMNAEINYLNLVPFSPYISDKLGYLVKSGVLNINSDIKIKDNKLNIVNKINLNKIKLSPDNEDKIKKVVAKLTLPLDYTLSVLRDKKGNVDLSVPVTGDLANPNFNLNDIYAITLAKALKKASVSYLKHLMQPYGALITIADLSMNYLGKINLDPILFGSNSLECSQDSMKYLDKVAKLLKEKDDLTISVFGVAVYSENETQDPVEKKKLLTLLAKNRAETIMEILISKGIKPQRIIVGHTELDKGRKAKPSVRLSI